MNIGFIIYFFEIKIKILVIKTLIMKMVYLEKNQDLYLKSR